MVLQGSESIFLDTSVADSISSFIEHFIGKEDSRLQHRTEQFLRVPTGLFCFYRNRVGSVLRITEMDLEGISLHRVRRG